VSAVRVYSICAYRYKSKWKIYNCDDCKDEDVLVELRAFSGFSEGCYVRHLLVPGVSLCTLSKPTRIELTLSLRLVMSCRFRRIRSRVSVILACKSSPRFTKIFLTFSRFSFCFVDVVPPCPPRSWLTDRCSVLWTLKCQSRKSRSVSSTVLSKARSRWKSLK
jgi:hypothetical protein